MAVAILLYNTVLTSILTLSIACAYYLYTRERHRIFAVLGVMFAVYLADNTIVYGTESIQTFAEVYDKMFIASPAFKTIYFVVLIGCFLFVCYSLMRPRSPVPFFAVTGFYAMLMICAPLIQDDQRMVWFFYLPTQLIFIGVSIWGLAAMKKDPSRYERPFYGTFKRILTFILIMGTMILVEDTIVIFCYDVYSVLGTDINNRNWSENILFIGISGFFIKYTVVVLGSGEKHLLGPLEKRVQGATVLPAEAFSGRYGLTEREHEILVQILAGKSQQEIGEDLVIALGTVKTHIHNIYHKMGVTKRGQLMARYQEFTESYGMETAEEM